MDTIIDRLKQMGFDPVYPTRAIDVLHHKSHFWEGSDRYIAEIANVVGTDRDEVIALATNDSLLDEVQWKYIYFYVVQNILVLHKQTGEYLPVDQLIQSSVESSKRFCIEHRIALYENAAEDDTSTTSNTGGKTKSKLDIAYNLFCSIMTRDTLSDKDARKQLYEAFESKAGILKSAKPTYFSQCKKKFLSQEL